MSNSIDQDEMAHYEQSHLDLCCLQKPIIIVYGSESVKALSRFVAEDFLKKKMIIIKNHVICCSCDYH